MIKKLLAFCAILFGMLFISNSFATTPVHAQDYGVNGSCDYTLGFTSWNCGVNIVDEDTLKTGIWTIAANIATDITVAAAYLVLGYVIYGGYLYMFAAGDTGKLATGKKTLYQAFLGLAITMSAFAIMSTIRFALLGLNGKLGNCLKIDVSGSITGNSCVDAASAVGGAISWFIAIAGIIAAIFMVYGGIAYVTSSGDVTKLKKAKETMIYALIGLAIVGLAQFITGFVTGIIRDANTRAQVKPTTQISLNINKKESYD